MTPPRVVLDTEVVLSALIFAKGHTARLRRAWQRGDCLPLVSTVTAQELVRVLAYPKFKLDAVAQQELLADYLPHTKVIEVQQQPAVPDCRELSDLPFLHLSAAGKAKALVTRNADLLALADQVPNRIETSDAFLLTLPADPVRS